VPYGAAATQLWAATFRCRMVLPQHSCGQQRSGAVWCYRNTAVGSNVQVPYGATATQLWAATHS